MRTGICLQFFFDSLYTLSPELLPCEGSADASDLSLCAREFGFYHHIADADAGSARSLISGIFAGALNAGGCYMRGLLDTVETHDERWDGSGTPCGLKGPGIPFWGRMCAIAETYDELRSPPHPCSARNALQRMSLQAGTALDPELTAVFLRCAGPLRTLKTK